MNEYDPGQVMNRHMRLRDEVPTCLPSPMRNCTGPCRKRRSHTQFSGASTMCRQCKLRAPKVAA